MDAGRIPSSPSLSISSLQSIPSIASAPEGIGPPRYRSLIRSSDLISVRIREKETDLLVRGERGLSGPAREALAAERADLSDYLQRQPDFATSLLPLGELPGAPPIARAMARAAALCGVGPLAAVAGALAQRVGEAIRRFSPEVIVENGGDLYLALRKERITGIFAGADHPLTSRVGILVRPSDSPLGIAASSGTIGPSLSWGKAAVAVVIADNAALADAAATALANRVYSAEEMVWMRAVNFLGTVPGIRGSVAVMGDRIQTWGNVELVETSSTRR